MISPKAFRMECVLKCTFYLSVITSTVIQRRQIITVLGPVELGIVIALAGLRSAIRSG